MTTYHLRGTDGTEVFTGTIQPPPGGGSQPGAVTVKEFDFTEQAAANNLTFPVLATSLSDQTITIAGDHRDVFFAGANFWTTGSWTIDPVSGDSQTVDAVDFIGGNTVITVSDSVESDTTDEGQLTLGSYTADLALPAGSTVLDVGVVGVVASWQASSGPLLWVGDSRGPGSYIDDSNGPVTDYDPTAVVASPGVNPNCLNLRGSGADYKLASASVASANSSNDAVHRTGPGVRYTADDTLKVIVHAGYSLGVLPITPTGHWRVVVTYVTPTVVAAAF